MQTWILAVLALFVLQTYLPATIRYLLAGPGTLGRLRVALGPRDEQPPLSPVGGRAARALANMQEAMPIFLALSLLHVAKGTGDGSAAQGAMIFFLARVAYVPAYLWGVSGLRSAVWGVSWVGLGWMIAALW